MGTIVETLAKWVAGLEPGDVPPSVVHQAKRCLVDVVGVALAGTASEAGRMVRDHAEREYAPGPCTVLGGTALSSSGAALTNAVAAHAYDYDDTCYAGIVHGSAVVFPAVLAAAEEAGVSGERLITAFVAGVEVEYALGNMLTDHLYFKGWHPTTVLGSIGATAGVAKVLGLDAEACGRALGIAGSHAASLQTGKGTPVKPFHAGRAAEAGVHFAQMARAGLPAPVGVFEEDRGFIEVVNDGKCDLAALDVLGRTWALEDPGVAFKLYPVCSAAQAAAEETARILAEEGLAAEDVDQILCEVTPLVFISLNYDRPRTPSEAQFSMPFAVGCMLAFGELGLARLDPDILTDPGLRATMAKVSMRTSPELADDPETPAKCPEGAFVTLRTTGGREIHRFNGVATGMPANPMSEADLERKFRDCAAFAGEDGARADTLIGRIGTIESLSRASELFGPRSRPFAKLSRR